jgi:hypothetical protein
MTKGYVEARDSSVKGASVRRTFLLMYLRLRIIDYPFAKGAGGPSPELKFPLILATDQMRIAICHPWLDKNPE